MLRFLQIRVVVNGIKIYPLEPKKHVVITLQESRAQIVVSDGFHFTPLEIQIPKTCIQYLTISCSIEVDQLLFGVLLLFLFYAAGLTSNLFVLTLLSFSSLFLFLICYYIKRTKFLKAKPV